MKTATYSIEGRLTWQLMAQAFVMMGLVCLGIYCAVGSHVAASQERLLDVKINKLAETAQLLLRSGDSRYFDLLVENAQRRDGTRLELHYTDGRLFYADPAEPVFTLSSHQREKRFVLPFADGTGALQGRYAIDVEADARMLAFLRVVLLAAVALGTFGAGAIGTVAVRQGLRPLVELARQTQRIAPHRLSDRLVLDAHARELQPFIDQFNALMDRLEQAYRQLESFNADVAHELRTPLSALIGQTELSISRERSTNEMRETLLSNLEELQRLSAITNDMLFLSRADRGMAARRDAPTGLAKLVNQVVEFHEGTLQERALNVRIVGDAAWSVEPGLFKQAVSNLLDNASRHATPGSIVTVHIDPSAKHAVRIVVENAGAELKPEHVPRLFDRFFRIEPSRSNGDFNHGLGLAIVAAIARMHRGAAWAESLPGTTRVGFTVA